MKLMLFTDGSVNTKLRVGYGAYLALSEGQDPQTGHIKLKQFVDTSSTKLELQTLLWALSEISAPEVISYTDSQNIVGLNSRRKKIEENHYYAKNGKLLNNHELYKQFYQLTDNLNITFTQIRGHTPSNRKSHVDMIFSLVDRASRNALRAYSTNSKGLPDGLPAWTKPLPFCYQSTGVETRFTNNLDPEPRSRQVFAFHQPNYFAEQAEQAENQTAEATSKYIHKAITLRGKLKSLPSLYEDGLWPAQIQAIKNLEVSLAKNCPRSLIQMATGSGKTFTAINFIYRLIKFAGARRILFLVDRGNLGKQTLKEFQQYVSPYNNFKFHEEYIVQRLTSNTLDTTARVSICTIQRLYSMLKGQDLAEEDDEQIVGGMETLFKEVLPLEYNPAIPISTFDFIVTDECHRSIYNLWRQVLEYFDAFLIGLTATPSKQTFGFFNKNLVMEYDHECAVADGVNVNYDVYLIKTKITEKGSSVKAGYYIDKRDRDTRKVRWEKLEEDFEYDPNRLDREVVSKDQIRTVIRTFKERVLTEIFPGRDYVPKTLIFAKDDSHAEDIVTIVREEFGKGNDFAQKITYKTSGAKPEDLIASFRNSFNPRIAVTVDMIATGTDIKPLEIVMFMRAVKSRGFFEQMKGRGVRIINTNDLQAVTPDAKVKDHFVIVDCVGVCEMDKTDSRPMERKPTASFEKLLQAVSLGNVEPDVISSLAARIARMARRMTAEDGNQVEEVIGTSIEPNMQSEHGEIVFYQAEDGESSFEVRLQEESVWLSLNQMVELFGRDKSVVSRHLNNIFKSGGLKHDAVVAKNATTAADGKTYQVDYYNLDAIISVGYRVNSIRGTQFRIWATSTLKDHLIKGYTVNERRLAETGVMEMGLLPWPY